MKKDLGLVQAVYPMPVLMVAAYDENEKVNVMNVAWGQICDSDKIILFIGEGKKHGSILKQARHLLFRSRMKSTWMWRTFSESRQEIRWMTNLKEPDIML